MKVLIVGTGWYGCHAAMVLDKLGIDFDMVDTSNGFMVESSTKNQNRLHLGFHYPRAYRTRHECIHGYKEFCQAYPESTIDVSKNLYLVAKDSLIDFQTYANIFAYEKTPFDIIQSSERAGMPFTWLEDRFDGFMLTRERLIDNDRAARMFESRLGSRLIKGYKPSDLVITASSVTCKGKQYALALDCTYGQLLPQENTFFELSCTWLYTLQNAPAEATTTDLFAFTVMDGPFYSIYPYKPDRRLFTLTHVAHTPLMTSDTIEEIRRRQHTDVPEQLIQERRRKAEADVRISIPNFDDYFAYQGYFLSVKTKIRQRADDRSMTVQSTQNVISFCGGKITGIFAMERYLMRLIPREGSVLAKKLRSCARQDGKDEDEDDDDDDGGGTAADGVDRADCAKSVARRDRDQDR
jgi:hypothetical protein